MSVTTAGEPMVLLLIEDNEAHAEIVKRSFEQHRVANVIHHVDDGQKALDYLFREGEYTDADKYPLPHCILLDLRLPKVDGLEVLRRIKSCDERNKTPVVVLTTSAADRDIAMAYEHRANSYVVKPMDFSKFGTLMDDLGYYWMIWNENPYIGPSSAE